MRTAMNRRLFPLFPRFKRGAALLLLGIGGMGTAHALDEIYGPDTEYRECALEYNGSRTIDRNPDRNNGQEHEIDVEAGITPRLVLETSAGFVKDPGPGTPVDLVHIEAQARYQLVESGEYWLDAGLLAAFDAATRNGDPDGVEVKLLLQKDVNYWTLLVNAGFSQEVGRSAGNGGPDYVVLANLRYRVTASVQPGIEMQSDPGQATALGHWNQGATYLGPALYGKLLGRLGYQAGYFIGLSDGAAQAGVRVLVEYESTF
jgi:hypothetical protein